MVLLRFMDNLWITVILIWSLEQIFISPIIEICQQICVFTRTKFCTRYLTKIRLNQRIFMSLKSTKLESATMFHPSWTWAKNSPAVRGEHGYQIQTLCAVRLQKRSHWTGCRNNAHVHKIIHINLRQVQQSFPQHAICYGLPDEKSASQIRGKKNQKRQSRQQRLPGRGHPSAQSPVLGQISQSPETLIVGTGGSIKFKNWKNVQMRALTRTFTN